MAKKKRGSTAASPVRWQQAAPAAGGEQAARRGPGWGAYLAPWITCVGMVPAGFLAHWWWGGEGVATGLAAAAIAAAGAAVTWVDHQLTKARTWWAHHSSTASVAAATVWLTAATALGPGRPVLDVLMIGGIALCTASNIHTWSAWQGGAEAGDAPKILPWRDIAARVGLEGTSLREGQVGESRAQGTVQLEAGRQTVSDLQNEAERLAGAMHLPKGAVRIQPDPADASRARLTVVLQDALKKPVKWPGFRHLGSSVAAAPVPLGLFEDGVELEAEVRNQHTLTGGMPGAGKSRYARVKVLELASRRDAAVLAIDTEKGRQTLGPLLDRRAIRWAALSKAEAKAMISAVYRAVYARADHLAGKGLENWEEGCGLTWLYVLIEEAANLLDHIDDFVEFSRVARSAGIHIEVSLQRATYTNIDTDARSNFGSAMCFGVRSSDDAAFILPEHVIDAGAAPATWGKTRPGCVYPAVEGIEDERQAIPARIYDLDNPALAAAVAELPDPAPLDPVTLAAFGQAYPGDAAAPAPSVTVTEVGDDEKDDDIVITAAEIFETPDPDPEVTADLDDEIPPPETDFDLPRPADAPKGSRESAEVARHRLRVQLQAWHDEGKFTFRAPEAGQALRDFQGIHRSRQWVQGELRTLAVAGVVAHEDDGSFTIIAPDLADEDGRELAGV